MAADLSSSPTTLSKVDSAIEDGDAQHDKAFTRRRTSSVVSGVFSINELGMLLVKGNMSIRLTWTEKDNIDLAVAPETQKLNW